MQEKIQKVLQVILPLIDKSLYWKIDRSFLLFFSSVYHLNMATVTRRLAENGNFIDRYFLFFSSVYHLNMATVKRCLAENGKFTDPCSFTMGKLTGVSNCLQVTWIRKAVTNKYWTYSREILTMETLTCQNAFKMVIWSSNWPQEWPYIESRYAIDILSPTAASWQVSFKLVVSFLPLPEIVMPMLSYFGKSKQVTYHLNLSYKCFHILTSVLLFQAKLFAFYKHSSC